MLKKILLLIVVISFSFNVSCSLITCMHTCFKQSRMMSSTFEVGENILDPYGSLWEYQGTVPIILGQVSSDLRLLTVFISGEETSVMDIHEEPIPDASPGDIFKLILPNEDLMADILSKGYLSHLTESNIFNAVIPAPLESQAESAPGACFCLVLLLDQ